MTLLYSFTTKNLVDFIKSNINYDPKRILICRDHCGPYYGDIDNDLSVEDALKNCINTIESDILNGFNLIHVDISRVLKEEKYTIADQLINHILKLNPDMMLEFGSEDNLSVEENNNQIHLNVLTTLGKEFENEFNTFKKYVLVKEVWKKWVTPEVTDDETKLLVSGHYFLNTIEARQLLGKLDIAHFKTALKTEIFAVLDIYRKGLGNEHT